MATAHRPKRLITCQGMTQLVTALAVLDYRTEVEGGPDGGAHCLVIHDLFVSKDQRLTLREQIESMARALGPWEEILYFEEEEIQRLLKIRSPKRLQAELRERFGVDSVDEIFFSMDWLPGNRLFFEAFPQSKRICYGDGFGFHFPRNYYTLQPLPWLSPDGMGRNLRELKKRLKDGLKRLQRLSPFYRPLSYTGYYVLPNALGATPEGTAIQIPKSYYLASLKRIAKKTTRDGCALPDPPGVLVLTSNFSEARRASEKEELIAYVDYLKEKFPQSPALCLLPHSRESKKKTENLRTALLRHFPSVTALPSYPIELLLASAPDTIALTREWDFVTFGTSCLSLKYLFGITPTLGFGPELVKKHFFRRGVLTRIEYEQHLKATMSEL